MTSNSLKKPSKSLPFDWYYNSKIYNREIETIFNEEWLYVCHVNTIQSKHYRTLQVDNKKFDDMMKKSRELAKKNWKGSGDSSVSEIWFNLKDKIGPTEFLGYETNQAEGSVTAIIKDDKETQQLKEGEEGQIILNQTPFYGESGGQVGDKGTITSGENEFEVIDVQKKIGNLFVHFGKVSKGTIKIKDNVELKINTERRQNIRAYHSATHLLHESLRRTLGSHVMQKGSLVAPDRLRFDFSHMKPITDAVSYTHLTLPTILLV